MQVIFTRKCQWQYCLPIKGQNKNLSEITFKKVLDVIV